jgi:hypothetical protein
MQSDLILNGSKLSQFEESMPGRCLPVLPALNEIKITLVVELVLILFKETSRSFALIDPSSNGPDQFQASVPE